MWRPRRTDRAAIHLCLRGLRAALITGRRSSKNKKHKAAKAFQEELMPRLIRRSLLIPLWGLSNKPRRHWHTLR